MSQVARERRTDSMAPEIADRLASAMEPGRRFSPGECLPALWHWAYFPELSPIGELGVDGHPHRTDELAQRFPRRMAGGGSLRRLKGLVVGEPTEKISEVLEVRERHGRSGDLVVHDWRHQYVQQGEVALEEIQSLVYLPDTTGEQSPAGSSGTAVTTESGNEHWQLVRHLSFGSVLLFRFSAATWNSHRIHYDRNYAVNEEGYPGLVVHGPLLTMVLAREAERLLGDELTLEFRSRAPLFDTDQADIYLLQDGDSSCRLEARKSDGTVTTALSASIGRTAASRSPR